MKATGAPQGGRPNPETRWALAYSGALQALYGGTWRLPQGQALACQMTRDWLTLAGQEVLSPAMIRALRALGLAPTWQALAEFLRS
ncbi:MAG: hypothetical protein M0P73_16280 [Syntrophobacterales bacterium]|nr:hypothetical protein [Syntrophobacterales bacterium]